MALDVVSTAAIFQQRLSVGGGAARAEETPDNRELERGGSDVPEASDGAQTQTVSETTEAIREFSRESGVRPTTRLSILFDENAALFVSRSVDTVSGEVLDQFPPETVLRRVAAFTERLRENAAQKVVDITV
ncbi:MAG: hypothetical protein QF926_04360 [Alphaproteobacteria bacterium]|jgi:hypothetical protein|nr:hypothetical protein [Alphaproteobacteria bacterium]MDP6515845.1 hypothetical protein [Alphaproteobacteria bacterium]|tara:strand:+ start:213 stop:608 length:396 start_codon:yes stop_codon:yes gene_type:complete